LPGAASEADRAAVLPRKTGGGKAMVVIASFVLGAILGARTALKRGGQRLDALQYGAGFGIAFGLLGLFLTILIERLA
jgi:hypothetical protein